MTITSDDELTGLQEIGGIVARTLREMAATLEPGMTTAELDLIGRKLLERAGAEPAPEQCYGFPGATCISVNEEIAHGIPGERRIDPGDLVNIDVSAVRNGIFADTGASFCVPPADRRIERLCRDGRRALWVGIRQAWATRPLGGIGRAVGDFARKNGYTLIQNLASHGTGHSLHEAPEGIATWPDRTERRTIKEGQVFTIEPFLSLGAEMAQDGQDRWTLYSFPPAPTVQYEHTIVATRRGPHIVTLCR